MCELFKLEAQFPPDNTDQILVGAEMEILRGIRGMTGENEKFSRRLKHDQTSVEASQAKNTFVLGVAVLLVGISKLSKVSRLLHQRC